MKTFRFLGIALFAILLCLSACSKGDDDPISPTPKPEVNTPTITLDSSIQASGLSFDTSASEKSISFTTTSDWTLSIAESRSGTEWCKASPTSGGKGTVNVKFTTTENTEPDDRSVAVTIKAGTASKTFTITQKGKDALLVTTKKYELPKEGGEIEIEVKSNVEYQMTIAESAKEWITEATGRALTTHKHILKIAPSEEAVKREGEIMFKSGDMVETVKVYQAGEAVLLLSKNEFTVSDAGETISVDIKSNVEYGVQMPDVDWIQAEEASRAMSSHSLKYIVKANEAYDNREAIIIFYDKNSSLKDTLKITQVQKDAIVLSKKDYNIEAVGEIIEVELSSNVEFEISIENDWVKQVEAPDSRGLVSHKLYFEVAKNESEEERSTKIIFTDTEKQITEAVVIKQRSKKEIPYLTFTADAKQTLTMTKAVETLEYSVNGGEEWKELGTNTIEFGGELGDLRLRGYTMLGTYDSFSNHSSIKFGNLTPVSCTGDIRTLINHEFYDICSSKYAKFCNLFSGCQALVSAPDLPATILAEGCYSGMFEGCTSLVEAPKLPATTLAESCYSGMFEGCTSLTEAPELPATTLAEYCYTCMFKGCTSLVTVSELPATTLAESCYSGMFEGCTSLTEAPELPATILADKCYNRMFSGCTGLTTAPELSAITLADQCYSGMFSRCSSITEAPELPAKIMAEECYASMFYECSALTIAPELPATTLANSCYASMFTGCTALTSAPELPATTLTSHCYFAMFNKCTSLESAPELPATIIAEYCYTHMFRECTSITATPELPATTLAKYCYGLMFSGCINLTTAPTELPATTLADNCYTEMFDGCTNLTTIPKKLPATTMFYGCYAAMFRNCNSIVKAPELPATVLAEACYASMFKFCYNLETPPSNLPAAVLEKNCYNSMFAACYIINSITMLATDISAEKCLYYWLDGVSNTGTFTKSPSMTSLPSGYSGIPEGWEVKDYIEE